MGRRDELWNLRLWTYIETTSPDGYDILINWTDRYLNWNTVSGSGWYWIRDNAGILETKNSGGAWSPISSSSGGLWGNITGTLSDQADLQAELDLKELLSNKSTDVALGSSNTLYPTQNAVKTYVDGLITGLLDYRWWYDASPNTRPATGGSGTAGAILKGDTRVISVTGTLGGTVVAVGDYIIANTDTPWQTDGNWDILNGSVSYVPLDAAGTITGATGQAQKFTLGVITGKLYPTADSATAVQVLKADGTTAIATFDTTNGNFSIGTTSTARNFNLVKTTDGTANTMGGISQATTFTNIALSYTDNTFTTTASLTTNQSWVRDFVNTTMTCQTAADANTYNVSSSIRALNVVTRHQGSATYGRTNAIQIDQYNTGAGTITNALGVNYQLRPTAGTITNAFGFYVSNPTTASVTNFRGFYATNITNFGTLAYGMELGLSSGTGKYNIYVSGTAPSHFTGNVSIGTVATANKPLEIVGIKDTVIRITSTKNASDWTLTDTIGGLEFYGSDTSGQGAGIKASIRAVQDDSTFGDDFGLMFSTGQSANDVEAMRITSGGKVGIGLTVPTAILHLKAWTATASTAPLKFTSGTLTTAPEAGAVEFLTDAYYATITTWTARKTFAFLEAPIFTTSIQTPTIELGHATDTTIARVSAGVISVEGITVPTISSTNTLTNKRITQRVATTTDDATAVIDIDAVDVYELTAVANATTLSTTGTPTDGQKLIIRLKDAGVAKWLTWDAIFVEIGISLPAITVAGKRMYIGATYNAWASKWHCISYSLEA